MKNIIIVIRDLVSSRSAYRMFLLDLKATTSAFSTIVIESRLFKRLALNQVRVPYFLSLSN